MNRDIVAVGCGYWGKNIVRNLAELGHLAAVCDANAELAKAASERHNVPVRAWDVVLADPSVKAVAIAAPAALHYEMTRAALMAGKDVFVEKPLALDAAEGEALCELAEKNGRILMVGHLLQYHPAFLTLLEAARSGQLGVLRYVASNRLNFGKLRHEENALWSFAPHDISMVLALAGQEPSSLAAHGASFLYPGLEDVATVHMAFSNGVRAHVHVSWLHPEKEQKLFVVGDQAMAVFDDGQPAEKKLMLYRHRVEWRDGLANAVKADGEAIPYDVGQEPLKTEMAHFAQCVATRARPRTDGREGLGVLRVLERAQQAMKKQA